MGSRGTSQYTDYTKMKSSGKGGNGGSSGSDPCDLEIDTSLEDVGRCDFYTNNHSVPISGSKISLQFDGTRLLVNDPHGVKLGYLPVKYNYIVLCINQGRQYSGGVVTSRMNPVPHIRVSLKSV